MIAVKGVNKYFGQLQVLKNISFEIGRGEIVGFLGQNGVGKTTLMRILTTFYPPTSGNIFIDGQDIQRHSLSIRRKVGYLPETPPLYAGMSVRDYLFFAAKIKDVPRKNVKTQVDKVLRECRLKDVQNKLIGILSKGYKQRAGIAQAIIHDPDILILDEPTSGLDPVQILQVRQLIKDLEYKRTILLSTHILSEIEQMAKRVIVMKDGAIVTDDALSNLLVSQREGQEIKLTLEEVFLRLVT